MKVEIASSPESAGARSVEVPSADAVVAEVSAAILAKPEEFLLKLSPAEALQDFFRGQGIYLKRVKGSRLLRLLPVKVVAAAVAAAGLDDTIDFARRFPLAYAWYSLLPEPLRRIVREAAGFGDRSGGRARIDLFDDEDMARFLLHPAWREESSLADARRRILKEDDDLPNGLAEVPVDEPGFVARARALRDAGLLKVPLYSNFMAIAGHSWQGHPRIIELLDLAFPDRGRSKASRKAAPAVDVVGAIIRSGAASLAEFRDHAHALLSRWPKQDRLAAIEVAAEVLPRVPGAKIHRVLSAAELARFRDEYRRRAADSESPCDSSGLESDSVT
jgi:hypothetical protein